MIIGAMNNPHKSLLEELMLFGEYNFDYAEITIENPGATPAYIEKNRKKIIDTLQSYNMGVLAHMPWYFSIAHPYERIQKAMNAEFESAFRSAQLLGAKKVTLHTETLSPSVQGRKMHVERTIKGLKELNRIAQNMSLELLVENIDSRSFSLKEFKELFSQVDMGMTLDVAHASTAKSEGYEAFLKEFGMRIKHMHISDNFGANDDHLPLGAGKLDIEEMVKFIKPRYDGTITIEDHSSDRHYLEYSRERLSVLWNGKKQHESDQEYLYPPGHPRNRK